MAKGRIAKMPAIGRDRKARPTLRVAQAWSTFRRCLGEALGGLEEDEYLILRAKAEHYFVQFAAQADHGMRAEAVSNAFITQSAPLSEEACRKLRNLGWRPPTYVPSTGVPEPTEGSPNFYVDTKRPVPYARLAGLAVKTLRTIYGIRHPEDLTYKSLSRDGVSIRFPALPIARRAKSSDDPSSEPSTGQREAPATATQGSNRAPVTLPDEQPMSAERVEAELRGRITTSEEALGEALWQLARFYSVVGRHQDATAAVERYLAATRDPATQAAACLGLGQLLEQQERYAEAETMYARGLEILVATAEVAYFLHNNRGYCLNILRRHVEAEEQCRAAIDIDLTRHNAHKNLGLAVAGQGRLAEAARCLLAADQRCPEDARARRHLIDLLAENPELLDADPALANACRERGIRPGRAGSA